MKITERDYIKAHRKASRKEEIERHGHPLPNSRIHRSKKAYDRNKAKAALKRQPFDFFRNGLDNPFGSARLSAMKRAQNIPTIGIR